MFTKRFLALLLINVSVVLSRKLFFEPLSNLDKIDKTGTISKNTSAPIHWVLLVAGSNEWYNYRHQADVCHAYQVVRKHGIPPEHIVTMMFNDIANSHSNPFPGKIFNKPDGPDVYEGVIIDYQGADVTPENFLAVLRGDEKAMAGKGSGKVIKSGPDDHVFVNFVDHGGYGILSFPTSELHVDDLTKTLTTMHKNKQYGQMVMYIEACESGSMLEGIPENIDFYGTTAANAEESSWACYHDDKVGVYLGDVYSVSWMEDSDVEPFHLETLHKQYLIVKKETNTSHVCEFGDKVIAKEALDNFQGELDHYVDKSSERKSPRNLSDAVRSEDVHLATLYRRLDYTTDIDEEKKLKRQVKEIIRERDLVQETITKIVHRVSGATNSNFKELFEGKHPLTSHACYKSVLATYKKHCFNFNKNGYAARSLKKLGNMCGANIPAEIISDVIAKTCEPALADDIHVFA